MQSIDIALERHSYPVLVGAGLLGQPNAWRGWLPDAPLVAITNDTVGPLYLDTLRQALDGADLRELVLADGEAAKNLDNWARITDFLASQRIGRDSCILALGGGVIGDISGFAAATWMRGIDFVQFPTTLLAQVDASVGGKTAINIAAGKNLVGAFHQPRAVIADIDTLATLPGREYRAGLAEVVKYGAIMDAAFLDRLESVTDALLGADAGLLEEVVAASVRYKADIVARDERESGPRALLNFGHSFAHALEALTQYSRFLHGEAVSIGMVIATRLSELRGLCPAGTSQRLHDLLVGLRLPVTVPGDIDTADMLEAMRLDKKNRAGRRRLVLLEKPGRATIDEASTDDIIRQAIELSRQD